MRNSRTSVPANSISGPGCFRGIGISLRGRQPGVCYFASQDWPVARRAARASPNAMRYQAKTPPAISAAITTGGVNRCAVIQWCVRSPTSAAGRNATSNARTSRRDSATAMPSFTTRHNRSRYSQMTARMAPSWMMISKAAARGPTNPSAWPARIRWPVDETGRNSVAPSTNPRMIAARMVGTASSYTTPGRERHAAPVRRGTVYTERDFDVAACGVRVRAELVSSTHQIFGVAARQARYLDVEGDRQSEAAVTGGTDSYPRGDLRVGRIELPSFGHRQQRGL